MKLRQRDVVLKHLQRRGSITQAQAWERYSISRLASVIEDLRRSGEFIWTEMLETRSKTYCPTKYARYRMPTCGR
jgi:hypothetical protein